MATKYKNVLNNYRAYSYHHILFMCDSTATAEAIAKVPNYSAVVQGGGFKTFRGRDSDKPLKAPNFPSGRYLVLINGLTDVDFYIESAQWYSVLMPRSSSGIPPFAMATEGSMKIVEPQGARLFNVLDKAYDALRSDPSGLVFLLKTIFVGHKPDGTSEPILNVKPFMIVPIDISAVFDHAGGTYNMEFMAVYNGAVKTPAVNKNQKLGIYGSTIEEALTGDKGLKKALNTNSQKTIDLIRSKGLQARPVDYEIKLDKAYQGKGFPLDNISTHAQNTGKGDPTFSFGVDEPIDSMIDKVMKSSKAAIKLAVPKQDDPNTAGASKTTDESKKKRKVWKIMTIIDSTPEVYNALYYVKQFELTEQTNKEFYDSNAKEHSVEFDYIFTGRNVDILEFDMKMEMGLGFMQLLANTANDLPEQSNYGVAKVQPTKATSKLNSEQDAALKNSPKPSRKYDNRPLTPASNKETIRGSTMRNMRDSSSSNAFQALLSRWAGYESVESKIKITGNPVFLSELSRFPSEIKSDTFPTSSSFPSDGLTQMFPEWESKPALVKINVMMPTVDDPNKFEKFWFQGHYYVFGVSNMFDNGTFTQELDLVALPEKFDAPTTPIKDLVELGE